MKSIKLNDKLFKEILIKNINYWHSCLIEERDFITKICDKKEITNNDLLKFYFNFNKFLFVNQIIIGAIFDYKMWHTEQLRLIKFIKVAKEIYPELILTGRINYIDLRYCSLNSTTKYDKFNKLVNIFLDEI